MGSRYHDEPDIFKKLSRWFRKLMKIYTSVYDDALDTDDEASGDDDNNNKGLQSRDDDDYIMMRTILAQGDVKSSSRGLRYSRAMRPIPFDHKGAGTSTAAFENYLRIQRYRKARPRNFFLKGYTAKTVISHNSIQCRNIEFDEDELASIQEEVEETDEQSYSNVDEKLITEMDELCDLLKKLAISCEMVHLPARRIFNLKTWIEDIVESKNPSNPQICNEDLPQYQKHLTLGKRPANKTTEVVDDEVVTAKRRRRNSN